MNEDLSKTNSAILKLIGEEFTDPDVMDTALYVLAAQAIGEAAQQGIVSNKVFVENLPAQTLEIAYRYESGLVRNKFFLEHFLVIRSFVVMDKMKLSVISKLLGLVNHAEKEKDLYKAIWHLLHAKMDALIMIAFLWKGYDYAVDFAAKLKVVTRIPEELESYLKSRSE